MTTNTSTFIKTTQRESLLLGIKRAMEAIWLMAVVFTPIVFIDSDYALMEAVISYVEVPKIVLIRTLAAAISILWLIEWAIDDRVPRSNSDGGANFLSRTGEWFRSVRISLRQEPFRWVFLAVWFFLGTTLLSTVLSGEFSISLWGEVPGQDGYPAYTIVAYVLVFAAIATHLKTNAQLWRVLGALVAMGTVVAGYSVLQHYGHDFLNLSEATGGGASRATAFMGNNLFAGAVMMMTAPVTLFFAVMVFQYDWRTQGEWDRQWKPWLISVVIGTILAFLLTVQMMGIVFSFARGPWIGAIFALGLFVVFAVSFIGWRILFRIMLLLIMTLAMIGAIMVLQRSVDFAGAGPPLAIFVLFAAVGWAALMLSPWNRVRQIALAASVAGVFVIVIILAATVAGIGDSDPTPTTSVESASGTNSQVVERFTSIKSEVLSGFGGGRSTHWKVSWELIKEHPWPAFDSLSLPWLRHLVGYGPELFRYTYLLRSPSEGINFRPLEPDHAHNFFIHQTVEQGFLGLFSALGLFASVFIVGGRQLLRHRQNLSTLHLLLIVGLMAVIGGRALEMVVGVARVSDLTVLWVLVGIFAALPSLFRSTAPTQDQTSQANVPSESSPAPNRRERRRRSRNPRVSVDRRLIIKLAIAVCLIGMVGTLTWVKSINYARASIEEADAVRQFNQGNWEKSLVSFRNATKLAPDVSIFHNNLSQVYFAYLVNPEVTPERSCSLQTDLSYQHCLGITSLEHNLQGIAQRPLYYRSHLAAAHSYSNLGLMQDSSVLYKEALDLVPDSWIIRNDLADSFILSGFNRESLAILEESLVITGDSSNSADAYQMLVQAYKNLGELDNLQAVTDRYLQIESVRASTPAQRFAIDNQRLADVNNLLLRIEIDDLNDDFPPGAVPKPEMVQYLTDNADIYLKFQQPALAPRFFTAMAFSLVDEKQLTRAAQFFHQSTSFYLGIQQSELAATSMTQTLLAFQTLGRTRQGLQASDFDIILEISAQVPLLNSTEFAAQLNFLLGQVLQFNGERELAEGAYVRSSLYYSESGKPNVTPDTLKILAFVHEELSHMEEFPQPRGSSDNVTKLVHAVIDQRRATESFVHLPIAEAALELENDPIEFYSSASAYVPSAWKLLNELADTYIRSGRPENALPVLERSLKLTLESSDSTIAMLFQGLAYEAMGNSSRFDEAFELALTLNTRPRSSPLENHTQLFQTIINGELERVTGVATSSLPQLEALVSTLLNGEKLYLQFHRPGWAPRFLSLIGLLSIQSSDFNYGTQLFHDIAKIYGELGLNEDAAVAFAQEVSAYNNWYAKTSEVEYLHALQRSASMYEAVSHPEMAGRLYFLLGLAYSNGDLRDQSRHAFEMSASFYSVFDNAPVDANLLANLGDIYKTTRYLPELSQLGLSLNLASPMAGPSYYSRVDSETFISLPLLRDAKLLDSDPLKFYQEFTAQVPQSWEGWNALADSYIHSGHPTEALSAANESLALTGDSTDSVHAMVAQAFALLSQDDQSGFEKGVLQALNFDARTNPSRNEKLAEIYTQLVRYEIQTLSGDTPPGPISRAQMIQYLSDNPDIYLRFQEPELAPRFFTAVAFSHVDSQRVGLNEFQRAAELFHESTPFHLGLQQYELAAITTTHEVLAYRSLGRTSKGLETADFEALSNISADRFMLDSKESAAQLDFLIGETFQFNGEIEMAEAAYVRSSQNYSEHGHANITPDSLRRLASVYEELSNVKESSRPQGTSDVVTQLADAIIDWRNSTTSFVHLPIAEAALELENDPIEFYSSASAYVPSAWKLLNELADTYIRSGRPAEALSAANESLALTGDSTDSIHAMVAQAFALLSQDDQSGFEKGVLQALNFDARSYISRNEKLARIYTQLVRYEIQVLGGDTLPTFANESALIEYLTSDADHYTRFRHPSFATDLLFYLGITSTR